jgi:hypothetical protein
MTQNNAIESKNVRSKRQKSEDEDVGVWPEFVSWLIETKGVARATAQTYAVQTRRILREVDPLSAEALEDWASKMESYMRTPFRSSWRSYLAFLQAKYGSNLPDFRTKEEGDVPAAVVAALAACQEKNGLSSGDLESLGVERETGKRFKALAELREDVADGSMVVIIRTGSGTLALIPKNHYETLRAWGGQTAWLVPSYPGSSRPMSSVKITRLVKRLARTKPHPQPQ